MNILMRHRVSPEVLQRCAEGGYGIPSGSAAQQPCPAPDPPALTANFIPTQVGRRGKPAARTAAYLAQHYLSTARLVLQTQVSRRKLGMCRELFVNEQCLVPNPHRPGQITTVGRQLRVVAKYLKSKTLEMLKQAKAIHLAFDGCTTKRHGKVLVIRVTAAVPKLQGQEQSLAERAGQSCSAAAPRLTTIFTDVVGVIQLASGTAEAHVRVIMQMLGDLGLAGMNIAGICADSASVNMGEFTGVIARISQLLQEEGQAITDLSSLLAQHWVTLKLDRWGAKPETPCDTRWASYIVAASSLLAVWRHAGEAVAEVAECQQRRAPAWARELCKHLQDSDLLLRITVVAVVGQTYLMPELLWASKDDGLHAFELYRHIQQVCKGLQQPWGNNAQLLSQLHSKLQQLVPIDQQEQQQQQQLATYLQQHCAAMEDYYRQHCKRQLDMPHLMAALGGSTVNNIDVHDFALQLPKLRAAVRLHEVAAAEARAPATAARKATAAACSVGVVVVNVGDHASQQRVAAAATTAGCSRVVPAGVPPPQPHPPPQPPPQQPPQQQGPPASPDFGHMYQLALAAIATEGQAAMAQAPTPGCTLRKRTTPAGLGQPQTAAKRKR
ncbi:hypothetical protein QJQ45_016229 [Haematococcus lacustris]|nr:hypothetical protein QJQ45_016229 [Haematococcus lacustris]